MDSQKFYQADNNLELKSFFKNYDKRIANLLYKLERFQDAYFDLMDEIRKEAKYCISDIYSQRLNNIANISINKLRESTKDCDI